MPCEPGGVPAQDPARIKALNIDWMCPILDWIKPDNITACENAALPMWLYTSLEPHAQYNNFRIDNLLWQSRFLFWQVAQLRFSGFLYYSLNAWGHTNQTHVPIDSDAMTSPFISPRDWNPVHEGRADDVGDGILVWAGKDGPLASTRLHNVRDGLEDHAYFELLRAAKGDAAVQAVLATVSDFENMQNYSHNLTAIMALRESVAEQIEGA